MTTETSIARDQLERYADLVLRCGVNLEPGQKLLVSGWIEHAAVMPVFAERAYALGAAVVQPFWRDNAMLRAQAGGAASDELAAFVPPWLETMIDTMVAEHWGEVSLIGSGDDDPFAGVSPRRVGDLRSAIARQVRRVVDERLNWSLCACPTPAWAARVYGEPDVQRLWRDLAFMLRLDEPDPVAAWKARAAELQARAHSLNEARFAALRFRGGETDLYVPLHADARFMPADFVTSWGRHFLCNLPTEEIFTTPDWRGVHGTAAATRPAEINGVTIDGLVVRFEDGRICEARASSHADIVLAQLDQDEGARALGEVALVDGSSRIGQLGMVFKEILLDENAASHIAWGDAYSEPLPDGLPDDDDVRRKRGVNCSIVHQDVMIGGPHVDVLGVTAEGGEVPVMTTERWQI